jgi:hypothetical protein
MTKNFGRKTTGADRKGIRGDIRLVLAEERPSIEKEPTAQKSAALINSVRYYGAREGNTPAEAMTATSAALYEYLMARWRPTLKDKDTCAVSHADAKAYLGIDKTSRLRKYMQVLCTTWVSYDFLDKEEGFRRKGSRVQLLNCEEMTHEVSGEHYIGVSMFPGVRKAILESDRWANLELGAYPRFTSKYTSLLYPTLALMSGRDQRPPLRWTPEELADLLGWQPDTFKFSNFESRVLQPVLDDIRTHVRRFDIECEYVRANTRGRPVVEIVITVGKALKMPEEFQKAEMARADRTVVRKIATTAAVDLATEMPGEDALRRAATRLDVSVREIATMWTEAFADERIMRVLDRDGVATAFEVWVRQQEGGEFQVIEADDYNADDEITDISHANKVILYVTEGFDPSEAVAIVERHLWTGSTAKTIRLVWSADDQEQHHDIEVSPTGSDLGHLFIKNSDVIESMEYAA